MLCSSCVLSNGSSSICTSKSGWSEISAKDDRRDQNDRKTLREITCRLIRAAENSPGCRILESTHRDLRPLFARLARVRWPNCTKFVETVKTLMPTLDKWGDVCNFKLRSSWAAILSRDIRIRNKGHLLLIVYRLRN